MENPSSTAKIAGAVVLLAALSAAGWYVSKGSNSPTEVSYQAIRTGSGDVVASGSISVAPGAEIAYVNRIEGEVTRNAASDAGEKTTFAAGESVRVGDTVATGEDSSVEIVFADASVVRLASNSSISITKSEGTNTEMNLES